MRRLFVAALSVFFAPTLIGCSSQTPSTLSQQEWVLWHAEYMTYTAQERADWCHAWDSGGDIDLTVERAATYLGIPEWKSSTMMNLMCH